MHAEQDYFHIANFDRLFGKLLFLLREKARGNLKSFNPQELNAKFKNLAKQSKEIWLCS